MLLLLADSGPAPEKLQYMGQAYARRNGVLLIWTQLHHATRKGQPW